jgi:hypothetical protein
MVIRVEDVYGALKACEHDGSDADRCDGGCAQEEWVLLRERVGGLGRFWKTLHGGLCPRLCPSWGTLGRLSAKGTPEN